MCALHNIDVHLAKNVTSLDPEEASFVDAGDASHQTAAPGVESPVKPLLLLGETGTSTNVALDNRVLIVLATPICVVLYGSGTTSRSSSASS